MSHSHLIVMADFDHMDWGAGGWILMAIGMAAFWGLIIVGVVWAVRTLSTPAHHRAPTAPTALEILDRGLAEGSISVEDYEQRRRLLTGPSSDA